MSERFEDQTDYELAKRSYLLLSAADDELPDNPKVDEASRVLGVLLDRLAGPYCKTDDCKNLRMKSFPWCPWHRPESYGPLPPDFPPNPTGASR